MGSKSPAACCSPTATPARRPGPTKRCSLDGPAVSAKSFGSHKQLLGGLAGAEMHATISRWSLGGGLERVFRPAGPSKTRLYHMGSLWNKRIKDWCRNEAVGAVWCMIRGVGPTCWGEDT